MYIFQFVEGTNIRKSEPVNDDLVGCFVFMVIAPGVSVSPLERG